jgi:putative membrane protein
MKILSSLVVLGLLAAGAAVSQEREGRQGARGSTDAAGDPDKYFAHCASIMNLAEISAGRLAEQRSQNEDVKKFGQRMVKDHTQANAELSKLASKMGLRVPTQADEGHAMMVLHLSKLNAEDFDAEYATCMVAEHAKAVAVFEAKAKSAKDPELKAWAEKTLGHLKHHLEAAKELQQKVAPKESK